MNEFSDVSHVEPFLLQNNYEENRWSASELQNLPTKKKRVLAANMGLINDSLSGSKSKILSQMNAGDYSLLMLNDKSKGIPVAYATFYELDDENSIYINKIRVDEGSRAKGIATNILRILMSKFSHVEFVVLMHDEDPSKAHMIETYKKLGFKTNDDMTFTYDSAAS